MANLLTEKDKKALMRRDIMTVVLVYVLGLLFTVVVGLVFLIPSHFLSKYKLDGVENRLELLKASVTAKKNEEISSTLNQTREILGLLKEEEGFNLHEIIIDVAEQSPGGVSISEFNSSKNQNGDLEVRIRGVASTRKAILNFVDYLKQKENYSNVNLPIGVLAEDADVDFDLSFIVKSSNSIQ